MDDSDRYHAKIFADGGVLAIINKGDLKNLRPQSKREGALPNKPFHLTPGLAPYGRSVRRR